MKKRVLFVEDYNIYKEVCGVIEMLRAKKIRKKVVLDSDVIMIEFKLSGKYYIPMVECLSRKYPNQIAFTTIGR